MNSTPMSNRETGRDKLFTDSEEMLKLVVAKFEEKFDEFRSELLLSLEMKDEVIKKLEHQVATLKHDFRELEQRLEVTEASGRRDEFILSGSVVSSISSNENLSGAVCNILKGKMKYSLSPDSILHTRRLGAKPAAQGNDLRSVLVKVKSSDEKSSIVRSCKTAKPSGCYINDNLTTGRLRILRALRNAKRRKPLLISACGSRDGRIFAWVKLSPDRPTKFYFDSWTKLETFAVETLGLQMSDLNSNLETP